MGFFDSLVYYYHLARTVFGCSLIFIFREGPPEDLGRRKDVVQEVVFVGDGTAMGFGDKHSMFFNVGVASYFPKMMKGLSKIPYKFTMLNRGHIGSKATDWLPSSSSPPSSLSVFAPRPNLYKATFKNPKFSRCRVVVMSIGSADLHDEKLSPADVIETLSTIALQIREDINAEVFVLGAPQFAPGLPKGLMTRYATYNKALKAYCDGTGPSGDEEGQTPNFGLAADLGDHRFGSMSLYHFDSFHFNTKGYKLLTEMVVDSVKAACFAAAWTKMTLQNSSFLSSPSPSSTTRVDSSSISVEPSSPTVAASTGNSALRKRKK